MYEQFPHNSIVVQKYGGTSVGNTERIQLIADRIARQFESGWHRLAIVVSAMAGETNRLVGLAQQVNPRAQDKNYDMVVAAGEQVSVGLMGAALEKRGLSAEPLLGYQLGILTDGLHSRARIQSIQTEKILECWERGEIPVIAGFQGMTRNHQITTLGRGGSDTSAVALAVALNAAFCEINTDVHGVYTSDPRIVPDARLIERLDYDVAMELAALGGKVLHSRCVELAAKYKMPLVVRESFADEKNRRTEIMPLDEKQTLEAPVVSGVTLDRNIAKVTLRNWKRSYGSPLEIFSSIASRGVNVDIIVYDAQEEQGTMSVGFTVSSQDLPVVEEVYDKFRDEIRGSQLQLESRSGLAKVSAVGLGMRSHSGVASRLFEAITRAEIEILMISTSEIKISCVVEGEHAERANRVVHDVFLKA